MGLVADPVIEAIARLEFEDSMRTGVLLGGCTANCYSKTTALLRQKGRTLDFAMAIGSILEFAVPLLLKSHISYY